jgi:hypothetical protein
MKSLQVFFKYFKWHYGKALIDSIHLWKNLTLFLLNFFSIKTLILNFFTPWKRIYDSYPKWYNFKEYFSTLAINSLMRIVGIFIRFFVIIFGLICTFIFIILYPVAFIFWIILPIILLTIILAGATLIIIG